MADPTWVGAGAISVATVAITPALPASIATDDILILSMRTVNGQASTIANAAGGTWTEFTNSPQDEATGGVRGTWFWSRYNGTQTAPTTNDSGSVNLGQITAWRGCIATGTPYDVTAGAVQAPATAMSNPGLVTTVDGCLIVVISVCDRDAASTANATAWANASLASITERVDEIVLTGVGGGFAIAEGVKTSAGTVSATTWTQAASGGVADLTIAFKPLASGATGTVAVTQDAQTSAASGSLINGTSAQTQAAQTSTASALVTFTATSTASQDAQTSTASGSVANPVTGTSTQTQADQTSTASGTVLAPITGTAAVTQADQISTAAALVTFTGTVAVTQDAQTSTASGTVANPLSGTVAATQADQTSTASGTETFTASSASAQADQTSTATGSVANPVTGTVAVAQADQTSGASGTVGAFPVVASVTPTVFGTATTSHLVVMPATVDAGDLLIVSFATNSDAVTAPGTWTELHSTVNGAPRLANYYRIADGTEDGTTYDFTTPGARKAVAHVYRITGWHGTTPPEVGTASTGNSANPDPPTLTPSWGSADGLWLATTAINGASTVSAYPTSYTDGVDDNTTGTGSIGLGTARRNLTATSDDPATFTISGSVTWVAQTIGIRPVAVVAPISGTVAVSQDPQLSTATGAESFTGTSAATQAGQTSTGTAVETFIGTSANIQADQGSAAVGVLGFVGSSTATQADQTSIANGTALFAVTGTVAVVQADQFSTATGVGGILTFWSLNPVGYTVNPVSHVKAPVAFVKVGAGDDPPW